MITFMNPHPSLNYLSVIYTAQTDGHVLLQKNNNKRSPCSSCTVPWRVIRSSTLTSTAATACSPASAPRGRSLWRIWASGGFCCSCSSSLCSHWPLRTTSVESYLLVPISWNSCVRIVILSEEELTEASA